MRLAMLTGEDNGGGGSRPKQAAGCGWSMVGEGMQDGRLLMTAAWHCEVEEKRPSGKRGEK